MKGQLNTLHAFLVEDVCGLRIRIYAANEYDAKSQVNRMIKEKYSLIPKGDSILKNMY